MLRVASFKSASVEDCALIITVPISDPVSGQERDQLRFASSCATVALMGWPLASS